jgi:hypothetical protein
MHLLVKKKEFRRYQNALYNDKSYVNNVMQLTK